MTRTHPSQLEHILLGKEFCPLLSSPDKLKFRQDWREGLKALVRMPPDSAELAARFHEAWHVCHHFVRELVDDDELLLAVMQVWLPPYRGPAVVLYRGENIDRFYAGRLGTAWSDNEETASDFAQGLNAVGKGGLTLRAEAPTSAIIAGPSAHSRDWLGENEYTVDFHKLPRIEVCARFEIG